MSTKQAGRGNIPIRRNLAESTDPYLPRLERQAIAACPECHAVYERRHWFFNEVVYRRISCQQEALLELCPACRKIRDRYAEGQVRLKPSPFLTAHKDEILRLIRNEAERAKGINPLERIIDVTETDGVILVTTTNEKLAQRIGRTLQSSYQGQTTYQWSDPKFLSVEWQRI